jgi:hypothetical protein
MTFLTQIKGLKTTKKSVPYTQAYKVKKWGGGSMELLPN